jgi:predicted metal-dependent peptidase
MVERNKYALDLSEIFENLTDSEIERSLDRAQRTLGKIIQQAVEATQKAAGTIPGNIQNLIDEYLKEPIIPWQAVLKGLINSSISTKLEPSTLCPNPALFPLYQQGIQPYPGEQPQNALSVVCFIDVSGSVSDQEYIEFISEVSGILNQHQGVILRLVMFDHALQDEWEISNDGDYAEKFAEYARNRSGYGGTSFVPAFKYITNQLTDADWLPDARREKQKRQPDVAIIFTDGYAPVESPTGPIPEFKPTIPVIWAINTGGEIHDLMYPRAIRIE